MDIIINYYIYSYNTNNKKNKKATYPYNNCKFCFIIIFLVITVKVRFLGIYHTCVSLNFYFML